MFEAADGVLFKLFVWSACKRLHIVIDYRTSRAAFGESKEIKLDHTNDTNDTNDTHTYIHKIEALRYFTCVLYTHELNLNPQFIPLDPSHQSHLIPRQLPYFVLKNTLPKLLPS